MCWSANVSMAFIGLQVLTLTSCYFRNQQYDRLSIVFQLPILLQECCQLVLHLHPPPDSYTSLSDISTCPYTNRVVSFFGLTFAGIVPTFICFTALATTSQKQHPACHRAIKIALWISAVNYLVFVPVGILTTIFGGHGFLMHCSRITGCGHLDWNAEGFTNSNAVFAFALAVYLGTSGVSVFATRCSDGRCSDKVLKEAGVSRWLAACIRDKWYMSGLLLILYATFVPLYLYFIKYCGNSYTEWSSVWCWSATGMCAWHWWEVALYMWFFGKDYKCRQMAWLSWGEFGLVGGREKGE